MEKMSWFKKVLLLLIVVAAIIPAVSLSEWACDHYEAWVLENPEGDFAPWLLWKVAYIHNIMGREDRCASTYGNFYETYKLPPEQVEEEDDRVVEARYRQAMAWYDRDIPNADTIANAHKYLNLLLDKYQGTSKLDVDREEKVKEYIYQCEVDGPRYSILLKNQQYAPDGSPNYQP